jgi:FKBP-type peptidyl-prolyl cis-trans isomerase FklB
MRAHPSDPHLLIGFGECDNRQMQTIPSQTLSLLAVLLLLLTSALSQQTPTAKTQQTPTTKSQSGAKTGQSTAAKTQAPLTLKTQKDKFSYALGMNIGNGMHRQGVDIDPNILVRGMKDALAGRKLLLTEDEARAAVMQVQNEVRQKQQEKVQAAGAANKKQGDEFLAANKAKDGIVTLPSGLQYKILTAGTGPKPAATDSVVCNYRGTLIDGKEFDSSYKRGQPATFPVNGVIKGWTEALQLMPVGSKWQLFIPPDLAYGERGAGGGDIGPDATLIFEVELLSIEKKDQGGKKDKDKEPEKQQ